MFKHDAIPESFTISDIEIKADILDFNSYFLIDNNSILTVKTNISNNLDIINFYLNTGISHSVGTNGTSVSKDIGSNRKIIFNKTLAKNLTDILKNSSFFKTHLQYLNCTSKVSTDWHQNIENKDRALYEFDSLSPVTRFMQYLDNGQHYPHYDSGYIYKSNSKYRTLKSLVIYLTDCQSGELQFINDLKNNDLLIQDRDHSDWKRPANVEEIYLNIKPQAGNIVIFNHRLCHGVGISHNENRTIIRMDVIYKLIS